MAHQVQLFPLPIVEINQRYGSTSHRKEKLDSKAFPVSYAREESAPVQKSVFEPKTPIRPEPMTLSLGHQMTPRARALLGSPGFSSCGWN